MPNEYNEYNEYEDATPLDWAMYELATIEYDYRIHPEAARRIRELLERVYFEEL